MSSARLGPAFRRAGRWKLIQYALLVALLGGAVYVLLAAVHDAADLYPFRHFLRYWWVLLAILVQALQYVSDGFFVQRLFRLMRFELSLADTIRICTLDVFGATILPLGQFGSMAASFYFYRRRGLPAQAIVFWNLSVGLITFVLLAIIFTGAMAVAPGNIIPSAARSGLWALLALIALVAVLAGLAVWLPGTRRRLQRYGWYAAAMETLGEWQAYASEIGDGWAAFAGLVAAKILIYYAIDVASIECCFLALHAAPTVALVATAYVISLVAGYIAMTPAGLGATDATLTLLLVGGGVSPSAVVGMLLLFRLVNVLLPAPLGAWSFYRLRHEGALPAAPPKARA